MLCMQLISEHLTSIYNRFGVSKLQCSSHSPCWTKCVHSTCRKCENGTDRLQECKRQATGRAVSRQQWDTFRPSRWSGQGQQRHLTTSGRDSSASVSPSSHWQPRTQLWMSSVQLLWRRASATAAVCRAASNRATHQMLLRSALIFQASAALSLYGLLSSHSRL